MPLFREPSGLTDITDPCIELLQTESVAPALADACRIADPDALGRGAAVAVPVLVAALRHSVTDTNRAYQVIQVLSSIDDGGWGDPSTAVSQGDHEPVGGDLVDALMDAEDRERLMAAIVEELPTTEANGRSLLNAAAWAVAREAVQRTGQPVDRVTLAAVLGVEVRPSRRPPAPQIGSATIVNEVVTTIDLESILGERNVATGPLVRRFSWVLGAVLVLAAIGAGAFWWLDQREGSGDGGSTQDGEVLQSNQSEPEQTNDPSGGSMLLGLDLSDPLEFSTASAEAELELDAPSGQVCYSIVSEGIDGPHPGSLRQGPAGFDGPVVVDLGTIEQEAVGCAEAPAAVIEAILADPVGHYLELIDSAGDFTLRAQLSADGG